MIFILRNQGLKRKIVSKNKIFLVDVDTNQPDEKSLITYISSLYDVFPEPPLNHPLQDYVSFFLINELL